MYITINDGRITNASSTKFSPSVQIDDSVFEEYKTTGKDIGDDGLLFEGDRFVENNKMTLVQDYKILSKRLSEIQAQKTNTENISEDSPLAPFKQSTIEKKDSEINEIHTAIESLLGEATDLGMTTEEIQDII